MLHRDSLLSLTHSLFDLLIHLSYSVTQISKLIRWHVQIALYEAFLMMCSDILIFVLPHQVLILTVHTQVIAHMLHTGTTFAVHDRLAFFDCS